MENTFSQTKYLEAVINAMGDMVRVVSREGKVEFTNDAYDRKIGGGKSTVGDHCYEIFGCDAQCEFCVAREVLATGQAQSVNRKHAGRVYAVTAAPVVDENGVNIAAVEVFRDMTLDYNIKQNLLAQNSKLQKDLQLARSMQQALVRNVLPAVEGYGLSAGFFPCEAVGGDIYDCVVLDEKLVMYVADVSGHGVMPAMLAVFFSRAVRTACSLGAEKPSEILAYVQKEFLKLNLSDTIYITGFVVVLEQATGDFYYANAGLSVVPLLYDGKMKELFMSAPPISRWFDELQFQDERGNLKPGGRMLIYSDGLNEAQQGDTEDKLRAFFAQQPFAGEQFVSDVRRELHTRPEDDLTLLILERN